MGFPDVSVEKNLPANEVDTGYVSSSPALGNPLQEEMETQSSIPTWEIPETEDPGGLHIVHGVAKSQTRVSNWACIFSKQCKSNLFLC